MFLSRVEVPWGYSRNLYDIHRAIWKLFPDTERESRRNSDEARQGFLFRIEENQPGKPSRLIIQSRKFPLKQIGEIKILAAKELNPQPCRSQQLEFLLTANPVKTINDKNGRTSRDGEIKHCRVPLIREEEQIEWLRKRLETIASIENVTVTKLPPIFFYKRGRNNESNSGKLVPVQYEGSIRVGDPERLVVLMQNGIGPAKAFGCGLMLVKRISGKE